MKITEIGRPVTSKEFVEGKNNVRFEKKCAEEILKGIANGEIIEDYKHYTGKDGIDKILAVTHLTLESDSGAFSPSREERIKCNSYDPEDGTSYFSCAFDKLLGICHGKPMYKSEFLRIRSEKMTELDAALAAASKAGDKKAMAEIMEERKCVGAYALGKHDSSGLGRAIADMYQLVRTSGHTEVLTELDAFVFLLNSKDYFPVYIHFGKSEKKGRFTTVFFNEASYDRYRKLDEEEYQHEKDIKNRVAFADRLVRLGMSAEEAEEA